jgi:cyclic dehypoxanthinyl futalosine synthase
MEAAHRLGMRTTATMMFGHVETLEERIEHLLRLRELQDRTGGFTAFIGWTYQPDNTELGGQELTSFHYLKTLAVSRIVLDNFSNIQASWVTQGAKIGQLSLRFGANDFGSLMIEENVVSAAGAHFRLTEAEIARCIQQAGFVPKRRTMHYEIVGDPFCWTHDVPALPVPA